MRWTDPVDGLPRRHARVWLDAATWRSSVVRVDAVDLDTLGGWVEAGRALVACRRDPSLDGCALGIALPDRRRLALVVEVRALRRIDAPLRLDEVIAAAPIAWRSALQDLLERGRRVGARFRVYGSLAWQTIANDAYVTARSDVDLLWPVSAVEAIDRVAAMLLAWERDTGLRADGEFLFAEGGVAWREWIERPERVLVKHADRVSLQRLDGLVPCVEAEVRFEGACDVQRS